MNCEICNSLITPIKKQNIEIYQCSGCKGFWIKSGDLNKLIKHKSGDIEFSSIDHHMHKDNHGILKCGFCEDSAMIKVNFIEHSDIVLDFCEECGSFWIDNDELDKMQEYVDRIEKSNKKSSIFEIIMEVLYSLPKA